ncbi:transposase [Candidatus Woesearchaeota archaeon]|nr:transposase [Candidatus Woesearchaeota archaeon]
MTTYSDDKDVEVLQSFAAAMLRSRRGVLTEYATLLRFPQGTRGFHRQYERLLRRVDTLKQALRAQVQEHLQDKAGLTLVIFDDTTIKKTGKQFENEGVHHDHTGGGYYQGFTACTTAVYKHGKIGVLETVFANDTLTKLEQCQTAFTSACKDVHPDVFLFDTWYALEPLLSTIEQLNKVYVTRLRSNRVVLFDNERVSLRELAASIPHDQYTRIRIHRRTFWVLDLQLDLNGLGEQRVIISKDAVHANPVFLTTNAQFTTKFVVNLYLKRFAIELFFKDAKQFLNLETFQCRSKEKWELHLTLIHLLHWCIQKKNSISKTVRAIRESVDKIMSYINKNELFNKLFDELRSRCQI